jgi:hypothetical protein
VSDADDTVTTATDAESTGASGTSSGADAGAEPGATPPDRPGTGEVKP